MQESCPPWFKYLSLQIFEWFQQRPRVALMKPECGLFGPVQKRFLTNCVPVTHEYPGAWKDAQLGKTEADEREG